jgi:Ca-activated chloride channel family protein
VDESDTREPEGTRPHRRVVGRAHGAWILRGAWVLAAVAMGGAAVAGVARDRAAEGPSVETAPPHETVDRLRGVAAGARPAREQARATSIVARLDDSTGAWSSPASPFGRETALENDPMSAIGALLGEQVGPNIGFGGLGLRGGGVSATADVFAGARVREERTPASDPATFHSALERPLSTFSADVDTAAYTHVRRSLSAGYAPERSRVRIEEMINYFDYGYAAPSGSAPFAVTTEVGACPWNEEHRLVQIGIQGRAIATERVPPRNLVFLIDVSGSMDDPDKLPLLVAGLELLVGELRPVDRVAMTVYAGGTGVVLPPTPGDRKEEIRAALRRLRAEGSTNGGAGIEQAYAIARLNFRRNGINRVILATDGDFNVGVTSEDELTRLIERERRHGVFLTVLGFGESHGGDATMELLADRGNGNYAAIDSLAEAERVLVREASSTLVTIAKDVKLQVEFDPTYVAHYRLIGYENRRLRDEEFDDDARDAGDVGAGHNVTALYEIVPALRAIDGAIATVKIRYKPPLGDRSLLSRHAVLDTGSAPSDDFRFAGAVAAFGMLLRGTSFPNGSLESVRALAAGAVGSDPRGDRGELLRLIDIAAAQRDALDAPPASHAL